LLLQLLLLNLLRMRVIQPIALSNELLQSLDVCRGHVHFDIVVSCTTGPEGYGLGGVGKRFEEGLTVVEGDDGIVASVDDVYWACEITHPIEIRKQIPDGRKPHVVRS